MNYNIINRYSSYTATSYSKTTITAAKEKIKGKAEKEEKQKQGNGIKRPIDTFEKTNDAQKADEVKEVKEVELSDDAKKLLKELKEKYGNMDFFVENYSTEKEAQSYLSRGTKEFSVLIAPETLEEMAKNKEVREKYEGIIDESTGKLKEMMEELGEDKEKVKSLGVSIDKEGNVSYYAMLDRATLRKQAQIKDFTDSMDKANKTAAKAAERAAEKKSKEKKEEKDTVYIKASSIEELLQKIKDAKYEMGSKEEKEAERPRFNVVL